MIKLFITVIDSENGVDIPLVETYDKYSDIDSFEMNNDALAYRIANIAREEIARIRKEKFLLDNPELNIGGEIDELTASTPF